MLIPPIFNFSSRSSAEDERSNRSSPRTNTCLYLLTIYCINNVREKALLNAGFVNFMLSVTFHIFLVRGLNIFDLGDRCLVRLFLRRDVDRRYDRRGRREEEEEEEEGKWRRYIMYASVYLCVYEFSPRGLILTD